jgi:hypothetical protein
MSGPEKSNIGGGGTRYTTHSESTGWLGEDTSTTRTDDYDRYGRHVSSRVTDSNGCQWVVEADRTTEIVGNDGRNDR